MSKPKTFKTAMSTANRNTRPCPFIELRNLTDGAWYIVFMVLKGEELTVKYQSFGDKKDSFFEARNVKLGLTRLRKNRKERIEIEKEQKEVRAEK